MYTQRSVRPVPQSNAFIIVSKCFENKTIIVEKQNLAKMPFVFLFTNPFLTTLQLDVLAARLPDYGVLNL